MNIHIAARHALEEISAGNVVQTFDTCINTPQPIERFGSWDVTVQTTALVHPNEIPFFETMTILVTVEIGQLGLQFKQAFDYNPSNERVAGFPHFKQFHERTLVGLIYSHVKPTIRRAEVVA